jgi:NADPH:quinone reductase-like Zn-dependent oxidoreductase
VSRELLRTPRHSPLALMDDNKGVAGVNMGHMWDEAESHREAMLAIVKMWETGKIKPHVHAEFSFEDADKAHAVLEEGRNVGKVVLTP